jgi:RNA polymerase sigma-70 factor (ECF subfamily)
MLGETGAASGVFEEAARGEASRDARLLASIRANDLRAFEELYRIYHSRLARFLNNILRSATLTEEALNDTMMVVWEHADRFSGKSKVSTWIFGIAYRKALKSRSRYEAPIEDLWADSRESAEPGPEQELGRSQAWRLLREAIGELSQDHRTVVDLTYFHDMGYRDIAEIMACPVDTVKTRMFHARRHLKAKLAGELPDWL